MKMSETMPFFVSTWMKVMAVAQFFLIGKEDFSLLLAISLPLGILLLPTTRHSTDTDLMALMCWQFLVLWCAFSMIQVSEQNNLAVSKLFTQLVFGETEQKGKRNGLLGKFGKNKRQNVVNWGSFLEGEVVQTVAFEALIVVTGVTLVASLATYIKFFMPKPAMARSPKSSNLVSLQDDPKKVAEKHQSQQELQEIMQDEVVEEEFDEQNVGACYLVYEPDSGGRLAEIYSKVPIDNAIGMWIPGPDHELPEFKFSQGQNGNGRTVLIGNCAASTVGRKNYASGWCTFVRTAQLFDGMVALKDPLPGTKGLVVDVYIYSSEGQQTTQLKAGIPTPVGNALAVACMPRNSRFLYKDIKKGIPLNKWLEEGRNHGTSSKLGSATNSGSSLVAESPAMNNRMSLTTPVRPSQYGNENETPSKPFDENTPARKKLSFSTPSAVKKPFDEATSFQKKSVLMDTSNILEETEEECAAEEGEAYLEEDYTSDSDSGACYLLYEPDSGGRLAEIYSREEVPNAIGKWAPGRGKKLPDFKFTQGENGNGRTVLIGNCAASTVGRKNYASGWCTFVRTAKLLKGNVTLMDPVEKGLTVDVYVFDGTNTTLLSPGNPVNVAQAQACACMPRNSRFLPHGVTGIPLNKWLEEGRNHGTSTKF